MSIVQNENRLKGIPDEALKQMYVRAAMDPLKVGTPEFLLLAGEMQARKDLRQKAAMGQGNKTPVIQDLLAEAAVPPQPMMPQAPAEAGIAAMPAPSVEEEFATGGIVAFSNGGGSFNAEPTVVPMRGPYQSLPDVLRQMSPQELKDYTRTGVLPTKYREQIRPIDYSTSASMQFGAGVATDPGVAGESLIQAQQRLGVVPPPSDTPPPPQGGLMQAGPPTGGLDAFARAKQLTGDDIDLYKTLGSEEAFLKARADERKEFGDVFKAQENAIQKSLDRIPGLEKQYDASILLKAAAALGSTPGGLLKGLTTAGGAVAGDVMAKAEKLTSIQDKIDERQAQLDSDRIKLARADNEKDRNEFARRTEKRAAGLQALQLAQAQIQGSIENTMLNVQSRERLGELQLEATRLSKEMSTEEARKTAAMKSADSWLQRELMKNPIALQDPTVYAGLETKRDALYARNLALLREEKGTQTATPDLAALARAELAKKGITK